MVTKRLVLGSLIVCSIILFAIIIVVIVAPKGDEDVPVPGLKFKPISRSRKRGSALIGFTVSQPDTYQEYVKEIETFLDEVKKLSSNTTECGTKAKTNSSSSIGCPFNISITDTTECSASNDYGYKDGMPCMLLILTNLMNWRPMDYQSHMLPKEIREIHRPGYLPITCNGISETDKINLGNVTVYPATGLSYDYFPLVSSDDPDTVVHPFVWVKFNPVRTQQTYVICRAWAKNINHNADPPQGVTKMVLTVE